MDINNAFCDDSGIYNLGIIEDEEEEIYAKNATLKYIKIL